MSDQVNMAGVRGRPGSSICSPSMMRCLLPIFLLVFGLTFVYMYNTMKNPNVLSQSQSTLAFETCRHNLIEKESYLKTLKRSHNNLEQLNSDLKKSTHEINVELSEAKKNLERCNSQNEAKGDVPDSSAGSNASSASQCESELKNKLDEVYQWVKGFVDTKTLIQFQMKFLGEVREGGDDNDSQHNSRIDSSERNKEPTSKQSNFKDKKENQNSVVTNSLSNKEDAKKSTAQSNMRRNKVEFGNADRETTATTTENKMKQSTESSRSEQKMQNKPPPPASSKSTIVREKSSDDEQIPKKLQSTRISDDKMDSPKKLQNSRISDDKMDSPKKLQNSRISDDKMDSPKKLQNSQSDDKIDATKGQKLTKSRSDLSPESGSRFSSEEENEESKGSKEQQPTLKLTNSRKNKQFLEESDEPSKNNEKQSQSKPSSHQKEAKETDLNNLLYDNNKQKSVDRVGNQIYAGKQKVGDQNITPTDDFTGVRNNNRRDNNRRTIRYRSPDNNNQ